MKRIWPPWLSSLYASPWTAIAIAALLGFFATLNHSLWRDEMNVWLIARDSPNFTTFIDNIHYDRAHPGLWHCMVAVLEALFDHPLAMQIWHWLLSVASLILFWRFSTFLQGQKWLFTFGYLPFYEYSIVARNYAVAMLILFAICALWPTRQRAYWPLAGLVALLANSNVYGLWIAIAIALTLALDDSFITKRCQRGWDIVLSVALMVGGCVVSLYFILPPNEVAQSALGESFFYFDSERLIQTVGRLFAGYYVVVPNRERWLDVIVCGAIAIVVVALILLRLLKKPTALAFYLLANGLILGFTYVKFMPQAMRHFGNLYLVLIAALWLAQQSPPSTVLTQRFPRWHRAADLTKGWFRVMLTTVLVVHLVAGVQRFALDLAVPNSAGRAAGAYMRAQGLDEEFIVGSRDAEMAPLSGYLGRPIYYPERQEMGSFTLFFKGDRQAVDQSEVLRQLLTLLNTHPQLVLVLTRQLTSPTPGLVVEPIKAFERSQNERYYVYWVTAASAQSAIVGSG